MKIDFTNENWTIGTLIEKFQKGEIQVPEIQRDVVWKIDKFKSLIDSVYSRCPCGSIVLWEPRIKDVKFVKYLVRPERLDAIEKGKTKLPNYFIIDGQQRLTALVASLVEPSFIKRIEPDLSRDWPTLFLDLRRLPKIETEASYDYAEFKFPWAPLHKVFDNTVLDYAEYKNLSLDKQEKIRRFRDNIRDYSFPVQVIKECSYSDVADVFSRVNTSGTELTTAEIHIAQIVPHWQGITKEFRMFLNDLKREEFHFGLTFLIKALTVLNTDSPKIATLSKKVKSGEISKRDLNRSWKNCKESINKVLDILKKQAPLDKSKYLTSQNVFIPPIFYVFLKKKQKSKVNPKKILRFITYAQLSSHYEASTENTLRKDLRMILEGDKTFEKGFEKLCKYVKQEARSEYRGLNISAEKIHGLASKHELLLFIYIAMIRNEAKDFNISESIGIDEISSEEMHLHHIFPFDFMMGLENREEHMQKKEISRSEYRDLIDDIANLTFISKTQNSSIGALPPSQYLENYTTKENLKAHFIPVERELWKPQNFDKFIAARRIKISKALNRLISSIG